MRGRRHRGVTSYLGIPYGAPAGGTRRFRPPEAARPWAGIRDATAYAPSCPQPADWFTRLLPGRAPEPVSEDCLALNVWTPTAGNARRPVMVWLHGGLFAAGSGSWALYAGDHLARFGDVVVVTVNHRLDALGYLHLPAVHDDEQAGPANAGMLDLVLALRWIRDNIAGFGGDPGNVTLFGQSGGAGKVSVLLAMPAAAGLFHRAILQSGARMRVQDRDQAGRAARDLLAELDIAPGDGSRLAAVPAPDLVQAATAVATRAGVHRGGAFSPVVDGRTLPVHPGAALSAGTSGGVPLMVGTTRDEATILHLMDGLSTDGIAARRRSLALPDGVWEAYQRRRPAATPRELLSALETDQWRRRSAVAVATAARAGGSPVFMYRFDWRLPRLGATHGAELPFVFRGSPGRPGLRFQWEQLVCGDGPPTRAARALADQVAGAWTAFARDGKPAATGLPTWPAYDVMRRSTMILDGASRVADDPDGAELRAWEAS